MKAVKTKINNLVTFIIIASILIVTIGVSIGVFYNKKTPSIVFVPSQPIILDKSINQNMHESSKQFVKDYQEEEYNYVSPLSHDEIGYQQLFDTLYANGTKVISTSGDPTELAAIKSTLKKYPYKDDSDENKISLFIDDTSWAADDIENIISVKFLANQASFIEGILSSMYVYTYFDDVADWTLGTWGGMQLLTVIQLLSGFEQGINWFNYQVLGTELDGSEVKDPTGEFSDLHKSLKIAPKEKVNLINYQGKTANYFEKAPNSNDTYFSNSFIIGEGSSLAIGLLNHNAKILFPIAGGQSIDALNLIRKNETKDNPIKYIGVDTDSKIAYPDYKDLVLSSSTKETALANYYALWYSLGKYKDEHKSDYFGKEYNPFDFIDPFSQEEDSKGWRYKHPSTIKTEDGELEFGDKFVGSYNNGGVAATGIDGSDTTINQLWEDFIIKSGHEELTTITIKEFMDEAINEQNFVSNDVDNKIENFSDTFLIGSDDKPIKELSKNTKPGVLWIPDWNIY